jgi:hypothetical protein
VETALTPSDLRGPRRIDWRAVSSSGRVVLAALAGMVGYAIARVVDELDRIHFFDQVKNHVFTRQIQLGQTTLDAVRAKGHSLDQRSHAFLLASWVMGFCLFAAYRYWRTQNPSMTPHTAFTQVIEKTVGVIYVLAIVVQFFGVSSSTTPNVDSARQAAMAMLVSRALLLPAAALATFVLLYREGAWKVAGETIAGTEHHPQRDAVRVGWLLRSFVLGCLYFFGVCGVLLTIPQVQEGAFAAAATFAVGALMLVVGELLRRVWRPR